MNDVKDSIGWADYTWNPVTGCKRGCSYCYARRIHERFNKTPFDVITYHSKRIHEPRSLKKPAKIFVGSMSDIYYWNESMVELVMEECIQSPQHTFMFLSKNMRGYVGYQWPANTIQGLTAESFESPNSLCNFAHLIEVCPRPFLSIEPILGKVPLTRAYENVELIIIGAMTGPGAIKPKRDWIQSVKDNVPEEKIYWKSNIKKYL
jgi:protein gp37